MSRKKTCECSFSEAQEVMRNARPKTRFSTKLFFWLFVSFAVLAIFMFWSMKNKGIKAQGMPLGLSIPFWIGTVATMFSIFFAMICFVRFIRSRSIVGGLFLTTTFSTAVFLGTSQMLPVLVPTTAAAFTDSVEATNNGYQLIVGFAQIGLFAVWFLFLLMTIYMHVRPVKRIDRYLQQILDGERVRKVRIGKAKQYRGIEEKIKLLSDENNERLERLRRQRQRAHQRRLQRIEDY